MQLQGERLRKDEWREGWCYGNSLMEGRMSDQEGGISIF